MVDVPILVVSGLVDPMVIGSSLTLIVSEVYIRSCLRATYPHGNFFSPWVVVSGPVVSWAVVSGIVVLTPSWLPLSYPCVHRACRCGVRWSTWPRAAPSSSWGRPWSSTSRSSSGRASTSPTSPSTTPPGMSSCWASRTGLRY